MPRSARDGFSEGFGLAVAERFGMTWRLWDSARRKRVAVLVSRYDHCLQDLLWRWRRGELDAELVFVASNWEDLRADVEAAGLPFHHVPVPKGGKPEAEAAAAGAAARQLRPDRPGAVHADPVGRRSWTQLGMPVINIHHSFLPAFAGAGPYEQAKERGVKLIGATAHYVTAELDAGPIIEQDVVRVTHAQSVAQLTRMGAEIERTVFARAVQWHCEDRVVRHGNTTVVF